MSCGRATFLRLKAHLALQDMSLTVFAARHGTGPNQLRKIVERYAASDDPPSHPTSVAVLDAVFAELHDSPILLMPVHCSDHGE